MVQIPKGKPKDKAAVLSCSQCGLIYFLYESNVGDQCLNGRYVAAPPGFGVKFDPKICKGTLTRLRKDEIDVLREMVATHDQTTASV
jgi:hypothetical protein